MSGDKGSAESAPTAAEPADQTKTDARTDGETKTPDGETLVVESPEQRKARETAERKKAVNRLLEDMRDELRQDLGQADQAPAGQGNPDRKTTSPTAVPVQGAQPDTQK
ncbi:hypothetical protein LBMAG53_16140 [Planctomycetota bacterium]|nr:hypothetical protein LBMAG53_16140 [Planctomycetota bacterium]